MSLVRGLTYVLAVVFWLLTAGYAVLVSQDFIYQQFLRPGLWPLLAWFAQAWPWVNVVAGLLWFWPRGTPTKRPDAIVWLASACWAGAALAGVAGYSLQALAPGEAALACALAASAMLLPLALAERPDARPIAGRPRLHTASDFGACVLAATVLAVLDGALAGATREPDAAPPAIAAWLVVRGPMLAGMVAFLALTLVRGAAVSRGGR